MISLVLSALVCISAAFSTALPVATESELSKFAPRCQSESGKVPRLVPNPKDCRSVFVCAQGKALQLFCPKGQVFSASLQKCLKQKECRKESDELTAFFKCPDVDGKDVVMFPHPTDCHMYYVCNHGTAYPRPCSANLHYNPVLRTCDWPKDAGCTARVLTKEP